MIQVFKHKIEYIVLGCIFLLVVTCCVDSFSKSVTIDGKTYWEIMNPVTGIQKVVDDKGNTIIQTESGINDQDIYQGGRQESAVISNMGGKTRSFFILNEGYYDENGKPLPKEEQEAIMKELYKGKSAEKVETDNNIINTNTKVDFGPNYDMLKYKAANGIIPIDKVWTQDFHIEKDVDGEYVFKCQKYNYEYKGAKDFRVTKGIDQNSYCVGLDDLYLHIDDDGRPALLVSSTYYENNITLINKDYVIVGYTAIINRSKQANEYGVGLNADSIPRFTYYGDWNNFENKEYISSIKTLKLGNKYYFIRYNEHQKEYYNEDIEYFLYDESGKEIKNATVRESVVLLPNGKKYELYNVDGKLINDNVEHAYLWQMNEFNSVYDELKDYYVYEKIDDNFVIIDKDGNEKISGIKQINLPIHGHLDVDLGDRYLIVFKDGKSTLYDKNINVITEQKDGCKFDVSGKGTYYMIDQSKFEVNEKSYDLYNMHGKIIMHFDKMPGKYEERNISYQYPPSTIYDYRRYFLNRVDELDMLDHENFELWAMATNQWDDVNVNYPTFGFEEEHGNLIIFNEGKYSLYDIDGNKLLDDYKLLAAYDENYLLYIKGFKYGLVDRKGNEKFSFSIFEGMTDDE